MTPRNIGDEAALDGLLRAYRAACPDPEASANFMPGVWARIESRRRADNVFRRMAGALVTAALLASVILGLMVSYSTTSPIAGSSWVQVLAAEHDADVDPVLAE